MPPDTSGAMLDAICSSKGMAHSKKTIHDLGEDIVKRIIRFAVVDPDGISVRRNHSPSHPAPGISAFGPRYDIWAREIYLKENKFRSEICDHLISWAKRCPRDAELVQEIHTNFWHHVGAAVGLKRYTGLRNAGFGVDERDMVSSICKSKDGFPGLDVNLRPQDINFQLNLAVLRQQGMDDWRNLRIPNVTFTKLEYSDGAINDKSGPIPGGVLETIVAKEMMTPVPSTKTLSKNTRRRRANAMMSMPDSDYDPIRAFKRSKIDNIQIMRTSARHRKKPNYSENFAPENPELDDPETLSEEDMARPRRPKAKSYFRFLDLPAEIRNQIYKQFLTVKGTINPSQRPATSHYRTTTRIQFREGVEPPSVLALLQINRQIYAEAVGVYYGNNTFVFYYPVQLVMFSLALSEERKRHITNITLWYGSEYGKQGNIQYVDTFLTSLPGFRSLKRFELVFTDNNTFFVYGQIRDGEAKLPGFRYLKEIARKGGEVVIRHQPTDFRLWFEDADDPQKLGGSHSMYASILEDMRKALRQWVGR